MSTYACIETTNLTPTALVMTGTSKVSTNYIDVDHISAAAFDIRWTGTPTGTLIIEESLNSTTWYTVNSSAIVNPSLTSPTGSAGSELLHVPCRATHYLRVTYTNSSGSGALTVYAHANGTA
jgi:hypothetical protein